MSQIESEPLSWLVLERHALGELAPAERARVEARLAASPEERARYAEITGERVVLPPLPPARLVRPRRPFALAAASLLAAAAAVLLMRFERTQPSDDLPGVKGGDVGLMLVSDRDGDAPRNFAEGERFKVRVTCPRNQVQPFGVLVFQAGERFEPLSRNAVRCGENLASWPGAFALDGHTEAVVCVAWGEALDRAEDPSGLGDAGVCERLQPERP